jgi:hemerythrin-like metal-binding protein
MAAIQWKDEYDVGIRVIDRQHRRIVDTLNSLYVLQDARDRDKELRRVFGTLREYVEEHFETEEAYIREHGCEGAEEQHQEHQHFIDTICSHQRDFLKKRVIVINLFNDIWDWFGHHIVQVDKRCLAGVVGGRRTHTPVVAETDD